MSDTHTQTVIPPLAPRRSILERVGPGLRTAVLAAPIALASLASAQTSAAEQLTEGAKTEMTAAIPLIVGLLVVGIGLTVAFMVNRNAKKGIKSAG